MENPDDAIIDAVLRGENGRFAELVERYQSAAWKLAYTFVGNFEDAREVSQDAFVKAYRHLGRFRRRARFSTWFYRIVANQCKDFLRAKTRQPSLISLTQPEEDAEGSILFEPADPGGDPRDSLADRELARKIRLGIEGLSMKQRTAFILHHLQGLPIDEVAEVMECRAGTVKAHLARASEHLRRTLTPYLVSERIR